MFRDSNSHDPKTDHFSMKVLIGLAVLCGIALLGSCGAFGPADKEPVKVSSFDGCDLYEFTKHGKVGYIARCPTDGMVATTDADGNVVVTIP